MMRFSFSALKGRLSNFHFDNGKPDIFIFATPRSGSTFLLELFQSQPGMKIYDEPLSLRKKAVQRELRISRWQDLTTMNNREEIFERYFERLKRNKVPELNRPIYWRTGRLFTRRIVFKILHGGEDMIPWFAKTFNARIVLLVRHPIPTALSHEKLPRLPFFLDQPGIRGLLTDQQVGLVRDVLANGTIFQQGIINWCLQNKYALTQKLDPNWALISYEELTVFPHEITKYLEEKLDLQPFKNIDHLIQRPSESTSQSDRETQSFFTKSNRDADRSFLIKKWKNRISIDEEKWTFETLNKFQIDYYQFGSFFPATKYRLAPLEDCS